MSNELLNILSPEEGTIPTEEEYLVFKELFKREEYVKQIKEAIERGRESIEVDYEDIKNADPEMAEVLISKNGWKEISNYGLKVLPPNSGIERIRYSNIPLIELKEVKGKKYQGKLVRTEGIVKMAGSVKPDAREFTYMCTCANATTLILDHSKRQLPKTEDLCPCKLPFKDYEKVDEDYEDIQWLKIQEKPVGSDTPVDIKVLLEGDLVNKAMIGDLIELTGVLSADVDLKKKVPGKYYIRGNNVKLEDKGFDDINFSEEEEEELIKLSKDPELEDKISRSIAPSIVGFEEEKRGIALQLFGGVPEDEGRWVRGDIHVLMMGTPGIGKTSIFRYISNNLAPKCVHASGKGASGVGLTATVKKAGEFGEDGEWIFEAGAMAIADGSLCVIDEIDKMDKEDLPHINDALESQEIHINRAGVNATLPSRCSVLAGGNPKDDRVDRSKDVLKQIDLKGNILSRFDLIYVREDVKDRIKDKEVAKAVTRQEVREVKFKEGLPPELLKKYIAYSRRHINPVINDDGNTIIEDWWVKMRNDVEVEEEDGGMLELLGVRFLRTLMRLTQARARMYLREEATVEDAYNSIEIVEAMLNSSGRDPLTGKISPMVLERRTTDSQIVLKNIVKQVIEEYNEEYYDPVKPFEWFNNSNIRNDATLRILELGRKDDNPLTGLTLGKAEEELKKGITLRLTNGIP